MFVSDIKLVFQIESWSVADVINWLQNKNLHKFIILFQSKWENIGLCIFYSK